MTKFIIKGGNPLEGTLQVFGAKNACLPLICAMALPEEKVKLTNIPELKDIKILVSILEELGCLVTYDKKNRFIEVFPKLEVTEISDIANQMRASIHLIVPLLAKKGKAKIPYPGGCSIGGRPIDITLDGLRALGVEFEDNPDYLVAKTSGLKGTKFRLHFPSVGATETLLMAASIAEGETLLSNIAKEPEVLDTIKFLNTAGADIKFIDDKTVRIKGKNRLHSAEHRVIPDRIITGTYAIIAALCAGDKGIAIKGCNPNFLLAELNTLKKAGVDMNIKTDSIFIPKQRKEFNSVDFETAVYDGFATDLQAPMMMFLTQAVGASHVKENIYENRFMHVEHLNNMGADIKLVSNQEAIIEGPRSLKAKEVRSTDLRASAALVAAGLIAQGETVVENIEHLDRGYENLDLVLNSIGAKISRID